jgi:hypothetical protein
VIISAVAALERDRVALAVLEVAPEMVIVLAKARLRLLVPMDPLQMFTYQLLVLSKAPIAFR